MGRGRICAIFVMLVIAGMLVPPAKAYYVGIWWEEEYEDPWEDCDKAQEDAEGFSDNLTSDPQWQLKFEIYEDDIDRSQWEYTNDQNYVETVHFAYYAGHGYVDQTTGFCWLIFHGGDYAARYSARIWPDYCDWGNEGPLKWVALAACHVGIKAFKALNGVHLICAAKCEIGEFEYGGHFGQYLVNGRPIKDAWFDTMDLADEVANVVPGEVNVLGEDSSVENDHIYGHGYVAPDPPVDAYYYEWVHDVPSGEYSERWGWKGWFW